MNLLNPARTAVLPLPNTSYTTGVRAGHVRRGRCGVIAIGVVSELRARRVPQESGAVVVLPDVLVPTRRVSRLIDARLVQVVVALAVERHAALEEQAGRQRGGPF